MNDIMSNKPFTVDFMYNAVRVHMSGSTTFRIRILIRSDPSVPYCIILRLLPQSQCHQSHAEKVAREIVWQFNIINGYIRVKSNLMVSYSWYHEKVSKSLFRKTTAKLCQLIWLHFLHHCKVLFRRAYQIMPYCVHISDPIGWAMSLDQTRHFIRRATNQIRAFLPAVFQKGTPQSFTIFSHCWRENRLIWTESQGPTAVSDIPTKNVVFPYRSALLVEISVHLIE